jgi:hypothetical protein
MFKPTATIILSVDDVQPTSGHYLGVTPSPDAMALDLPLLDCWSTWGTIAGY